MELALSWWLFDARGNLESKSERVCNCDASTQWPSSFPLTEWLASEKASELKNQLIHSALGLQIEAGAVEGAPKSNGDASFQ